MTRVVIVQEYVPTYRAPFFEHLRKLAASVGIDVVVAAGTPSGAQTTRGDAAETRYLHRISQSERRMLGRRITVRDIGPAVADADFVVLEQARRNIDAYRMLGGRRTKPTALWGHGRDYTHAAEGLDRAVYNWLTRRADWFFAYTDGGRDAVSSLGFPRDRITVVENSIDASELARSVEAIDSHALDDFTRRHDLHGKTALFIGGLDASKRLSFLLDAGYRLAKMDPQFRLVVAGTGADEALITAALPHARWLRYLGPLRGQDKALALAASQVIAMPGRVGLVAVDSFASGTPIVTTRWPWHAPEFEYLRDGTNAVVSSDSVEGYTSELHEVLNDVPRLATLSRGAVLERDRYTIENMARRYLDGLLRWREEPRRL